VFVNARHKRSHVHVREQRGVFVGGRERTLDYTRTDVNGYDAKREGVGFRLPEYERGSTGNPSFTIQFRVQNQLSPFTGARAALCTDRAISVANALIWDVTFQTGCQKADLRALRGDFAGR